MKNYEFTIILDASAITDELEEALGQTGCLDGLLSACNGVVSVLFDRESDSLENAMLEAIADVQRAGVRAVKVEIDSDLLKV